MSIKDRRAAVRRRGIFVSVRDRELIRAALAGRSYKAVQAETGVPSSTIGDLVSGAHSTLSAAYAAALEAALGQPPGSLFGLTAADVELLAAFSRAPVPA